jgi:hypothetical protein
MPTDFRCGRGACFRASVIILGAGSCGFSGRARVRSLSSQSLFPLALSNDGLELEGKRFPTGWMNFLGIRLNEGHPPGFIMR